MNSFHILGFAVNNHTTGLVGILSNIKQFAILATAICKFFYKPAILTLGDKIQRSLAYIYI